MSPSDQTEGSEGSTRTVREMVVVLVKLPEVPVIVTVTVPVVAVLLAVRVKVLVLVVLVALNDTETPPGIPEAEKATLPLKPFSGFTVIVLMALAPCVTVKLLGEAERVKFGGGFTVRESVVALAKLPAVPVMVPGLNDAVTPAGKPEADKLTVPLKPLSALIVMVLVPLAPWAMDKPFGEVESVKFP